METRELIQKINASAKPEDVFDPADFSTDFKSVMTQIHPDVCGLDGAASAAAKMGEWKAFFENGKQYKDDAATFVSNGYWCEFRENTKFLGWSLDNYRRFKALSSDTDKHFQKYLPQDGKLLSDGTWRLEFDKRSIPLSGLTLPQEHVNWVLNRLLEYCAYLSEIGFVHCGLNMDSVFITPENHGIQVVSFYHLTRIGNPVGTISGSNKNWYPHELFTNKIATPLIDVECCKRIAATLLGDPSGMGIKFKKTHNEDFINFLLSQHDNAHAALTEYRALLKKNFKKEFHILTI